MLQDIQPPSTLSEFVFSRLVYDLEAIHIEASGVIENIDIEFVHRIRIAIRRYRNNLKLFRYFADQSFYDFLLLKYQETSELSSLLAFARDLDIQDYLLEQGLDLPQSSLKSDFLKAIREERNNIQNQLVSYFNTSSYTLLINHIDEINSINSGSSIQFLDNNKIFDAICGSFAFALSILYPITENTDGEEVHRFRKAIRRVRYTLETFQPVIAYPIDEIIEESHLLQDLLGDMHDLDMLNQTLVNTTTVPDLESNEFLEIINNKHQLYHLQFIEKLQSKEIMNFLNHQLERFSKEQTTIWK